MTTARTTQDLIAEAEATEAALIALWDELKGTLPSPDAMTQKLSDSGEALALGAQTAASTATSTVKSHPFAAAALVAGAAWFLFGAKRGPAKPSAEAATAQAAEAWKDRAMAARERAQQRLEENYANLRAEAAQTAEGLTDAGAAKLRDASHLTQEKATITADLARDLSEAFHHGLSAFGADAKARVVKAREQGLQAALNGRGAEASLWQKGQEMARQNPLSTAALGLAAGLGVAWMLPRSRAAIRSAAPGAIGAVVTPAAALVAQNLMARASKLMDPFVLGDRSEAEAEAPPASPAQTPPVNQTVKDAAKAAAMAGVAKAVGEAIGNAGAERAAQAATPKAQATTAAAGDDIAPERPAKKRTAAKRKKRPDTGTGKA